MGKRNCFGVCLILLIVLFATDFLMVDAQECEPSGKLKGKKHSCNQEDGSDCCKQGKNYKKYECSPPVTQETKAILTLNDFQQGGDGGGASECDGQYHSNDTPVVALSTGWFNKKSRCNRYINIRANGRSVNAMVVDECDSTVGCDKDHNYGPPCRHNIVDASKAVWKALEVPHDNWGELDVVWSDA